MQYLIEKFETIETARESEEKAAKIRKRKRADGKEKAAALNTPTKFNQVEV